MELVIKRAAPGDLEMLMKWRMEVLREVFSVPADQPMDELDRENRRYYERMLQNGGHIACFACVDGEAAGCGGLRGRRCSLVFPKFTWSPPRRGWVCIRGWDLSPCRT